LGWCARRCSSSSRRSSSSDGVPDAEDVLPQVTQSSHGSRSVAFNPVFLHRPSKIEKVMLVVSAKYFPWEWGDIPERVEQVHHIVRFPRAIIFSTFYLVRLSFDSFSFSLSPTPSNRRRGAMNNAWSRIRILVACFAWAYMLYWIEMAIRSGRQARDGGDESLHLDREAQQVRGASSLHRPGPAPATPCSQPFLIPCC
jgi:hypothetical protein